MKTLLAQLHNDDAGFVVSAELVLVASIAVLGLVVGLSEVALNINSELEDVGTAFTCVDQGYRVNGIQGCQGFRNGAGYWDQAELCDGPDDIQSR